MVRLLRLTDMMHLLDHYEEEKGDNLFLLVDPEVVRGEFDRLQDGVGTLFMAS
jgi:hypothetical protein